MSKITIDITSGNQMQTLTYEAGEFELLNNTGVDDGHVKIAKSQGTSGGVYVPASWIGHKVLCIRIKE